MAGVAAGVAHYTQKLSLLHIAVVIVAYQVFGGMAEWLLTGSFMVAVQDFTWGLPGMLFQIIGGWLALKGLAKYEF